jgi:hypothetical protein
MLVAIEDGSHVIRLAGVTLPASKKWQPRRADLLISGSQSRRTARGPANWLRSVRQAGMGRRADDENPGTGSLSAPGDLRDQCRDACAADRALL